MLTLQLLNKSKKRLNMEARNINSARSNNSSLTSNAANEPVRNTGKNDLEIISVNNPNYLPSKHSNQFLRPDSARYRLLQDLKHTNLGSDCTEDVLETNHRKLEVKYINICLHPVVIYLLGGVCTQERVSTRTYATNRRKTSHYKITKR